MNKSNFVYNPDLYPDYTIRRKVKDAIIDILGVDKEDVTDNVNLIYGLGADSLDLVELIMAFEKDFGISIPDSDVEDLPEKACTFSKCIEIIKMHLK